MKQLIQNYKTGELSVMEVPEPNHYNGSILVKTHNSLISAGTERSTVKVAKASLLGKAIQRPDLVKQVIGNFKKEGISATLEKIKTKLDSLAALGYSSSGTILSSLDTDGKFSPGQRVACAGQNYASHAEIVNIPQKLVAHIPDNVSFEEAAFTTLGAIALQGVRQADPTLGENICVIGLGLLGQITCQLLKANGCNVVGVDLNQSMVDLAHEMNSAKVFNRNSKTLEAQLQAATNGYGFDKVIITAAAPSNDPIVLATEILRKKGQIILVGAVPIQVPRDPHFYRNELELKISCSYGPGRYDPSYEEEGNDYPIGYVRWTEQRNMEAFLCLLSQKKLDLKPLISHVFNIEDAIEAYDIVQGKNKTPHIGILFKYPNTREIKIELSASTTSKSSLGPQELNIGFIGAGSFAQSYLIPMAKTKGILNTVITSTGVNAISVKKKFGFLEADTNADTVFNNESINAVFVATRHDTHANYVINAIKSNKAIFVEKPLCLTRPEFEEIKGAMDKSKSARLLVGYNRRFAPITKFAENTFSDMGAPLVINYRINAGFVPRDHWTQMSSGGGRILGEVCHFVDLIQYLTGSKVDTVFAQSIQTTDTKIVSSDNISITLSLKNGSLANITYIASGDKSVPKERIEIFGGNKTFIIDDFAGGSLHENNKRTEVKLRGKGHKEEVEKFCDSLINDTAMPISLESIYHTTETTFAIIDSLATNMVQSVEDK